MTITTPAYLDAALPIESRVSSLMAEMTLDEKLAQLGSYWVYQILDGSNFSQAKARSLLKNGIGHITRVGGASNVRPAESAALTNTIQKFLLDSTRLKIPAIIHEECCSGYMARDATVFPQAIGVASTWEPELVQAMTDVIRQQMRSVGAHHALAPVLDVTRDARWGRVEETFGEDPYLVARMGVAYVTGLQGSRLSEGIAATAKHFVGYGMSEGGMNWAPPHLAPRELREVYLHPFEAAVREGQLASIMNGYHELDGVPCGASKTLLSDILRHEWGFDGTVVSDYFAITQLYEYHHVAQDKADAAWLALNAGLDIELPHTDSFGTPLKAAVEQGKIPLELIDQAVQRALIQKFRLGIFDQPFVDAGKVAFDTPDQRKLARQIAEKSIVLLKNEGNLLPLSKTVRSLAVIGPNADSVRNLFGDYAYPAHIEAMLERKINMMSQVPVSNGLHTIDDFIQTSSILTAIKNQVSKDTHIRYAKGCEVLDPSTAGFAEAVQAAKDAEVAIVVVGDKAGLTDDCTTGEARDRADLNLPGVQADLVRAIYETGTPVVLVLVNGRPVTLPWIADHIPAILEVWFPSEEGANATADVLFGDVNPGGKLPMTFPLTVGQVPTFYGHPPSGGRSHWKVDYVETSSKPLYPFGYGLSYTCFQLDDFRISPSHVQPGESVAIAVNVTNTGSRTGDEVVQVYTHQYVSGVTRPLKALKGFQRVTLEPGQTKTVTFTLGVNQLGFYDHDLSYVVEPGTVEVMVGSSSQDLDCSGTFEITGKKTAVPKAFFSTATVR